MVEGIGLSKSRRILPYFTAKEFLHLLDWKPGLKKASFYKKVSYLAKESR
jgi:hypothetical protein